MSGKSARVDAIIPRIAPRVAASRPNRKPRGCCTASRSRHRVELGCYAGGGATERRFFPSVSESGAAWVALSSPHPSIMHRRWDRGARSGLRRRGTRLCPRAARRVRRDRGGRAYRDPGQPTAISPRPYRAPGATGPGDLRRRRAVTAEPGGVRLRGGNGGCDLESPCS